MNSNCVIPNLKQFSIWTVLESLGKHNPQRMTVNVGGLIIEGKGGWPTEIPLQV